MVGNAVLLWLTCSMRAVASGNLTVELIRAQRFDVACQDHAIEKNAQLVACKGPIKHEPEHPVDRVELSPEALASDPWATEAKRVNPIMPTTPGAHEQEDVPAVPNEPERLSPVVGSPALAGLGAAWIVPGTLLDVVA